MSVLKKVKNLVEKRNEVTKERNDAEKASTLAAQTEEALARRCDEINDNYVPRHAKKSHKLRNAALMFGGAGVGVLAALSFMYKDDKKIEMPKEPTPIIHPSDEDKEEKVEEKKNNTVIKGEDRSNSINYDKNGNAKADLEDEKTYGGEKEPNQKEYETVVEGTKENTFKNENKDKLEEAYDEIEFKGQEEEEQDKEDEQVPDKGDDDIQQEEKEPEQTEKGTVVTDPDRIAELEEEIEWER